jgi:hypothetical protein
MANDKGEQAGAVNIHIDGEGKMGFLQHMRVREGRLTDLAALPGGTVGGRASAAIVGKLKDGSYAFIQTSLRLLLDAATAFRARYGVEADGRWGPVCYTLAP